MLVEFGNWLEATPPATALRSGPWLYPAVLIFHLVGAVLVTGAVALLHLRVFASGRRATMRELGEHLIPWAWAGLALALVTGVLLFASEATALIDNPLLLTKLVLLALAGLVAWLLHRAVGWGRSARGGGRGLAALSLAIWFAILGLGKLLAYI